jgi:hypothetical protein
MTTTIDPSRAQPVNEQALSDEEVARFWADGYLLVRGVLSRHEAEHYRQAAIDLFPRDLSIPEGWHARQGRFKPYKVYADGRRDDCIDTPELLPLFAHPRLYAVMAQLLASPRLRVYDGSIGYTMRNDSDKERARSQNLHLDWSVPPDGRVLLTPEELQVGGCFYFTDVEPDGGGIHLVPGGHRIVEDEVRAHPDLQRNWAELEHLESIEVTGQAGDFALLHHFMPHGASHNRRNTTRVAQFLRFVREDQPHGYGRQPPRPYNDAQLDVMTPLARRLLGLDPW